MFLWELPYHTIFNWSEFGGRFVLCDRTLEQPFYDVRFLEATLTDECSKERTDFSLFLKQLRTKVDIEIGRVSK